MDYYFWVCASLSLNILLLIIVLSPNCSMYIHRKYLEWKKKETDESKKVKIHFTIEYYPLAGKYYPKYKGYYLYQWYGTGIIETQDSMVYAKHYSNENDALKFIELFKEQEFKTTVVNIPVND